MSDQIINQPDDDAKSDSLTGTIVKGLLVILILSLGFGAAFWYYSTRPKPKKKAHKEYTLLVEVIKAKKQNHQVILNAIGITEATRSLSLQSRVGGEIKSIHPNLTPGSILPAQATLLEIDQTEYKNNIDVLKGELSKANEQLHIERGAVRIAESEWSEIDLSKKATKDEKNLALRKYSLERAEATVASAKARLSQAIYNLEGCTISLPFKGVVISEEVEVGQQISPRMSFGKIAGADNFRVRATIPLSWIKKVSFPIANNQKLGSEAEVSIWSGSKVLSKRKGRVSKLLPGVENVGRMAEIFVDIADPLGLNDGGDSLLLGAHVRVKILGENLKDVFVLPRNVLRSENTIFLMLENKTLEIRKINPIWMDGEVVIIKEGIQTSELIIKTNISTPVNGMSLSLKAN